MDCPSCGFENPDGMNFCGKCATSLGPGCPNCGFKNPPGFEYCGKCAAPISGKRQVQIPSTERQAPEAERRQITVMFCDLVGSTALSEKLDPEDMRQLIHEYQKASSEVITRFDGYIAKYLGDGILVYFGYPKAHEDDAHRAVRAGLSIGEALGAMSFASSARPTTRTTHESPLQQTLQMRIGIHTGLVVVGEMGIEEKRETMAIVGETPNIAARVQEIAEPNSVLISSSTHKLVEGYFEFANLGPHNLKGISSPVTVYRAIKESEVRSRLEVAVSRGLTPLIGREQEIELLFERWERVKEGMGHLAFVSGEAGIGKSRLVRALKERLANESFVSVEHRCSPYHQNSALYPIIDHLERLLEFKRQDSHQQRINKLEKILETYGLPAEDTVPLLASLLSIPLPDRYPPINLTSQRQKQMTYEALIAWLREEAERQTVLYIVEDLHWVDPSTLEYLSLFIEQVATARIFALFTFRPDFSPPWPMRSHLNQIVLGRLTDKQVGLMVERVAGNKRVPSEVLQNIVAKTDGVPLYVEELTKMVLESGLLKETDGRYDLIAPLPPLAIPATLHDSLMARLDRITTGEICGLAATLGRSFTYELLSAVTLHNETELQTELNRLVEAELIYQRGLPPNSSYMFKHALIQEAAYQSLLKSKRRRHHEKIAQVLEERFQEITENQPEILAHHYTEAGLIEQAIEHWKRAGLKSRERSANIEAISQLTKGLELTKTLPNTSNRAKKELDLQIFLSPAWMALKGYAAPEVEQAYTRARELCEQIGETPHLFPVLWGLWIIYHVRAHLKRAHEFGDQLLNLAQRLKDDSLLVEAHRNVGATLFFLGKLEPAQSHLDKSQDLYDSQKHHFHVSLFGQDPGVASLSYGSWTLWLLGYQDQALDRVYEALTLAQKLSHPFSLVYALTFTAWIHQARREEKAVQEQAERTVALCSEQGFEHWGAWATSLVGWGVAELEHKDAGIAKIREGLANSQLMGSELLRPYYLSLLGEAYGKAGQTKDALLTLDEAITTANRNEERVHEAEIYRLKGELLLSISEDNKEEAEKNFHQALTIARGQSAKSLELRTAVSFSRHFQKHGENEEARNMLSEIYGWFTEGFDTRDLKEAKALLEELS